MLSLFKSSKKNFNLSSQTKSRIEKGINKLNKTHKIKKLIKEKLIKNLS